MKDALWAFGYMAQSRPMCMLLLSKCQKVRLPVQGSLPTALYNIETNSWAILLSHRQVGEIYLFCIFGPTLETGKCCRSEPRACAFRQGKVYHSSTYLDWSWMIPMLASDCVQFFTITFWFMCEKIIKKYFFRTKTNFSVSYIWT